MGSRSQAHLPEDSPERIAGLGRSGRFACTYSDGLQTLRHGMELTFKESICMVRVFPEGIPTDLALPNDEVIQQRDADGAPNVAYEVWIPETGLHSCRGTPIELSVLMATKLRGMPMT